MNTRRQNTNPARDVRGSALDACEDCGSRLKSWNGRAWYCGRCGAPSGSPHRHHPPRRLDLAAVELDTEHPERLDLAAVARLIAARIRSEEVN